jgi:hypothetical protein
MVVLAVVVPEPAMYAVSCHLNHRTLQEVNEKVPKATMLSCEVKLWQELLPSVLLQKPYWVQNYHRRKKVDHLVQTMNDFREGYVQNDGGAAVAY